MNDQLKQRLVGAIVLVSLAVIILPEIFKGDGNALVDKDVPAEPDYRFPPPKEAPDAPPMATAPIVPVGDAAKDSGAAPEKDTQVNVDKETPVTTKASAESSSEKKAPAVSKSTVKTKKEPELSKSGQVDAFIVQVGSFSSEPNAVALRDRLRKMGFTSFVEAVKGEQGMIYRVRVGPELTRKLADKLKEDLAKKAKLNGMVQSYP